MKIDFYGHTLELNDEILEKHGKFAGYAYAETDEEYKESLIVEIRAEIDNIYGIDTNINELFISHHTSEIQDKIEKQFKIELEKAGKI